MHKFCLRLLAVGIVGVAANTTRATPHAKSNNGSEITWAAGYPKANKQSGFNPPVLFTKFTVQPAPLWTPTRVVYTVKRWANQDGTGYNGEFSVDIGNNFSEEKSHNITGAGKSVTVVEIYLTVTEEGNSEHATELDSNPVIIRD